jgi:hypothetical protein
MPGLDIPADTWMNVLLIVLALVIASTVSVRLSVRDWKEDQIVFASAFCTLFGAIILAAAIVGMIGALVRSLRAS